MKTLTLALALLTATAASAGDCCKKTEPKPDACCAAAAETAAAPAEFSANSLYQLDATFTDDTGKPFVLGSLRGRPVVLAMFFASCGYACPLTLADLQRIRAGLPAGLRERTAFVLVSFDVQRDTPAALANFRAQRNLDAQFTLLHGDDSAVRELAALVGVKFKQEADGAFAHSNLITILNSAGEITHQRVGLRDGLEAAIQALSKLP